MILHNFRRYPCCIRTVRYTTHGLDTAGTYGCNSHCFVRVHVTRSFLSSTVNYSATTELFSWIHLVSYYTLSQSAYSILCDSKRRSKSVIVFLFVNNVCLKFIWHLYFIWMFKLTWRSVRYSIQIHVLVHTPDQCFSTAGPRSVIGLWNQLRVYRAERDSPGICHFSFLSIFMNKYFIVEIFWGE
jgi:hypothetical protein